MKKQPAGQLTRPSRGPAAEAPQAGTQRYTVLIACGKISMRTIVLSTTTGAKTSVMKNAHEQKVIQINLKMGVSPKLLITFLLQMSSAPNRAWLKTPRILTAGRRTGFHSMTRRLKKNSKSFTRKISINSLTEAILRSSH